MVERETIQIDLPKLGRFAAQLSQWDKRLVKVIAIGDLVRGEVALDDVLQLVCTFHPEPVDENHGFHSVYNLLMRNDCEYVSEQLEITQPVDLGFMLRGKVYLPDGKVLDSPGTHVTLWPNYDVG